MSYEKKGIVHQVTGLSPVKDDQNKISSVSEPTDGQDSLSNAPGQLHMSDVHNDVIGNYTNLESGYGSNILSSQVNNIEDNHELGLTDFNLYENSSLQHLDGTSIRDQTCHEDELLSDSDDDQQIDKITVSYNGTDSRSNNDLAASIQNFNPPPGAAAFIHKNISNLNKAANRHLQKDKAAPGNEGDSQNDISQNDLAASSTTNGIPKSYEGKNVEGKDAFLDTVVENGFHNAADANGENSIAEDLLYVIYGDSIHPTDDTFFNTTDGSHSSHFDTVSSSEINGSTCSSSVGDLHSDQIQEVTPVQVTREILQETDLQSDLDVHRNCDHPADYRRNVLPFLHLVVDIDLRRMHQLRRRVGRNCLTCFQHPVAVQNWPCGCICNCTQCAAVMMFCSLCQGNIESYNFFY